MAYVWPESAVHPGWQHRLHPQARCATCRNSDCTPLRCVRCRHSQCEKYCGVQDPAFVDRLVNGCWCHRDNIAGRSTLQQEHERWIAMSASSASAPPSRERENAMQLPANPQSSQLAAPATQDTFTNTSSTSTFTTAGPADNPLPVSAQATQARPEIMNIASVLNDDTTQGGIQSENTSSLSTLSTNASIDASLRAMDDFRSQQREEREDNKLSKSGHGSTDRPADTHHEPEHATRTDDHYQKDHTTFNSHDDNTQLDETSLDAPASLASGHVNAPSPPITLTTREAAEILMRIANQLPSDSPSVETYESMIIAALTPASQPQETEANPQQTRPEGTSEEEGPTTKKPRLG